MPLQFFNKLNNGEPGVVFTKDWSRKNSAVSNEYESVESMKTSLISSSSGEDTFSLESLRHTSTNFST